ncbi:MULTISPECIES: IclR family transcriptional regulator [Streptomyces]|uniref:DNA-binding IclR family transcriptional regulator n=1 Tax=Streptomyces clavifer TaxID=68188 RepID=A0ABS4V1N3_9ACTN|nr:MULTISPECIES: IclR family transcriptional regulator [Streptomyces]MBP2357820.1 DNA-binding IclR family transcriptional regulator [Streptomyces clavifer]MDX2742507.1 IclR family transcriptional regulator [Streptomyces sp. NRRL_B-2557]RPK84485.1 Acetate operon repressor [Streptomyces sp. ADI97-07]GHA86500.1 IclR family transcriptional regulator [Streptomyces clavifer]
MIDGRMYGEPAVEMPARAYIIESLDTGLRLMQLFLTQDTLTVSEAAHRLGIGRSTAHRVLSTLESRGFAVRAPSGRGYEAGPELLLLGRPAGFDAELRARLGAVLDDAVRRTGETVQSAALIGGQVVLTDGRESAHPVRVAADTGRSRPAHATAAGKVLLARLTADQVCALYPQERLTALTPHTVVSRAGLLAELAEVRELGRAFSRGECVPGLHAVAVTLTGASRRDRLALSAASPADRGDDAALAERAEQLRQSAARLTAPADLS